LKLRCGVMPRHEFIGNRCEAATGIKVNASPA
jgi:hypothetical protein